MISSSNRRMRHLAGGFLVLAVVDFYGSATERADQSRCSGRLIKKIVENFVPKEAA